MIGKCKCGREIEIPENFSAVEGAYEYTSDDVVGRFYIAQKGHYLDKRGRGHITKQKAFNELASRLCEH